MQRILIALFLCLGLVGCPTLAAETAPAELRAIPSDQAALLTTLIGIVEADCPDFEGQSGTKADLIEFLQTDREAWRKLAQFYNPKEQGDE